MEKVRGPLSDEAMRFDGAHEGFGVYGEVTMQRRMDEPVPSVTEVQPDFDVMRMETEGFLIFDGRVSSAPEESSVPHR